MPSLVPKTNSVAGSATAPNAGLLVQGELAENKSTGRLYMKTESDSVVDPARVILTGAVTGTTSTATSEAQAGTIVTTLATVAVSKGGTGATTAPLARAALGATASGANSDITSVALSAASTISVAPSSGDDIVNKTYADLISSGINFHDAADYATVTDLSPVALYQTAVGTGVGAKLTSVTNGALVVDGVSVVAGKRILVKNQTASLQNGIYTVTQQGTASLPYILTRATDYDTSGSGTNEVQAGDFVLILSGNTLANTAWVQQTSGTIVIGTTSIGFTQFAAPTGVLSFSTGATGLTVNNNVGAVTLSGTLDVNNGGTGVASLTGIVKGNGASAMTAATSGTDYVAGADVSSYRVTAVQASNLAVATATSTKLTFSAGAQATVDGHTIQAGDVIFLAGQTASATKGPWVVTTVGEAPTTQVPAGVAAVWDRPVWWTTGTARAGVLFSVSKGTTLQGSVYTIYPTNSIDAGITIGTTGLTAVNLYSKTGIPIASGGTGAITQQGAINSILGGSSALMAGTSQPLISDGTDAYFAALDLAYATSVTGILPVFNGGTGAYAASMLYTCKLGGAAVRVGGGTVDIATSEGQVIWLIGTGATIVNLPDLTLPEIASDSFGLKIRIINKTSGTATIRVFGLTTALTTIATGVSKEFIAGPDLNNTAVNWFFF